jgi:hypothetical protein
MRRIRRWNVAWMPPARWARWRKFLFNVERDPMALKIESVEITARDKEGQNLSLGLQISGLGVEWNGGKR